MKRFLSVLTIVALLLPQLSTATEIVHSTVAVQGYDVVAYFTDHKPVKGDGNHVATQDGVNYLFASDEHKKMFEANPKKYMPAYGVWCAIGVTFNKKVISDPTAWKIVDGELYLNLNKDLQNRWSQDIPGNIKKADDLWPAIKDKDPAAL